MYIKIKGLHFELTDAIQDYIHKKLAGLEKFLKDGSKVEVEVGKTTRHHQNGDIFRAEININVKGKFHRAESEKSDLYAAIDEAREEMLNILANDKDRSQTLWKKGAQKIKNLTRGMFGRGA
jgi:putative sigma-54 modulation protein